MYRKYIKMSEYFPKLYEPFGREISGKLDLSNYDTKVDLKTITGVDTFNLAKKSELASVKSQVEKIDVDILKTVPVDFSNL